MFCSPLHLNLTLKIEKLDILVHSHPPQKGGFELILVVSPTYMYSAFKRTSGYII